MSVNQSIGQSSLCHIFLPVVWLIDTGVLIKLVCSGSDKPGISWLNYLGFLIMFWVKHSYINSYYTRKTPPKTFEEISKLPEAVYQSINNKPKPWAGWVGHAARIWCCNYYCSPWVNVYFLKSDLSRMSNLYQKFFVKARLSLIQFLSHFGWNNYSVDVVSLFAWCLLKK